MYLFNLVNYEERYSLVGVTFLHRVALLLLLLLLLLLFPQGSWLCVMGA